MKRSGMRDLQYLSQHLMCKKNCIKATNDNIYYVAYLKIINSKLQEIEGLY